MAALVVLMLGRIHVHGVHRAFRTAAAALAPRAILSLAFRELGWNLRIRSDLSLLADIA